MGRKKSKTILIILIIMVIILILLAGVAYCYFATDLFKSNKDLFFKYMGQIGNNENGFIDNNLLQYMEKKKNTPYTNEGDFSLNVTSNGEGLEEFENLNNFNISFSGQINKAADEMEQDISLNYSDEINFPINYKQISNTIGVQTKYVSSKYLAVETDNLSNLTESANTTIDITEVTQGVENLAQLPFSDEDLQQIKDRYTNVLNTQLQNTQFTKVEDVNYTGYQLNLTGEELKNIIKQLLETLKSDETTLTKINEYLEEQDSSSEITSEIIDEYIQEIEDDEELNDEILKITVFAQNGQTKKVTLEVNEFKIQLEKIEENNTLKYNISLETLTEDDNITITLTANYSELKTMQNISETYEIEIAIPSEENLSYKYQLNNNITFTNQIDIEEFSNENAMILTDYDAETVNNFLGSVVERIQQVNKQQMEQLGLKESENPLFQLLLPISSNGIVESSTMNDLDIDSLEISTFNEKFQMYESTNLKGTTVKGLLSTIAINNGLDDSDDVLTTDEDENTSEQYLITEINFNGEEYEVNAQNITFIKNEVNLDGAYRVEFEMDEDTGAIYRAVINEKVGE